MTQDRASIFASDDDFALPRPTVATEGPDAGLGELFSASLRTTADEISAVEHGRMREAYQRLRDDLIRAGVRPSDIATESSLRIRGGNYQSAYAAAGVGGGGIDVDDLYNRDAMWSALDRLRQDNPLALPHVLGDRETWEQSVLRRGSGRTADQRVLGRSRGVSGFLATLAGGAVGSFYDPVNIALLPFGGGGRTIGQIFLREALLNGAIEALQTPQWLANRRQLGEVGTVGEAAMDIGGAAVGGGALASLLAGLARGASRGIDAYQARQPLDRQLARALDSAQIDGDAMRDVAIERGVIDQLDDTDLANLLRVVREGELLPEERAAVTLVERQAEVDAVNPYVGGSGADRHGDQLLDAVTRILTDMPADDVAASARVAAARPDATSRRGGVDEPAPSPGGEAARQQVKSRIRQVESGGNDSARNPRSTATGRYQFTSGTWLAYYRRRYPNDGASDATILARRSDPRYQEQLMDDLLADNQRWLRRNGYAADAGNLYLVHFAGQGGAERLLRGDPSAPVESALGGAVVAANPHLRGRTVGETIAWARGVVGDRSAPRGVVVDDAADIERLRTEAASLREEALQLSPVAVNVDGIGRMTSGRFSPDEIDVDAALMQFKAGGDDRGVTDRLQGVEVWNPVFAGRVIVWEAADGRRLIADGHQRLGLAQRIAAADPGQRPMLDALVLREDDGFDAESVRTWAALKNIAEGSGTPIDAAKVFRAMGEDAQRYLPPRSALVRDARGLARLADEPFGAVVNELVQPQHAAIVGMLSRDPGEQKALVDLLIRLQPRTLGEADGIVRQGISAGFVRETQSDMFGELDSTVSLMLERARVLERGLSRLGRLKKIFSTAADNADTLDQAGNRIDATRSAQEAQTNAEAIDIIRRVAWSAGPVKDAIDAAAQQLAAGRPIDDVVKQFVSQVRQLDFADLVRRGAEVERPGIDAPDGGHVDGYGRVGDAAAPDDDVSRGFSEQADPDDNGWPTRAEIEAAGQGGFDIFDAPTLRAFDEPTGAGATAQADSIAHDVAADIAGGAPLLRDAPDDAAPMFLIGEGDNVAARSLPDLLAEFDADDAAIAAARKCL